VSLLFGVALLALAVALGGLAAIWRDTGRRAMHGIRTFAVVAAGAVAVLHLLPEALSEIGWPALVAAAVGLVGPALLERSFTHDPHEDAPTTALAMGYAAVVAHQAGEGAALAGLARTGALTASIVLAIAAHTVPLAMVVAIRVIEARGASAHGTRRATVLALGGVAGATIVGALGGNLVGAAELAAVQPWVLAVVAGLLLHALSHDVLAAPPETRRARVGDATAGLVGLGVAVLGVEDTGWLAAVPFALRVAGVLVLGAAIAARSLVPRKARGHAHPHAH
jgi:ZIP family zinc transporter